MKTRISDGQPDFDDICGHWLCRCTDCVTSASQRYADEALPFWQEARS